MYEIEFTKSALKIYLKLPSHVQQRIKEKVHKVSLDPYQSGLNIKPMKGYSGYYRLRSGDYRVVYELNNKLLLIKVIKIGHRREVYK